MSDPFVTATEFSRFLGINEPSDLARMQMHLEMASAVIRRYCDQELSQVVGEVETFQAVERETLLLSERPVTAITALTEGGVAFADYTFSRAGIVTKDNSAFWDNADGTSITYTHGYVEADEEYKAIKSVCLAAASRAFTLNERSASEAMGSTIMESAGYSPEVFLTQGEKWQLMDLGKVGVG